MRNAGRPSRPLVLLAVGLAAVVIVIAIALRIQARQAGMVDGLVLGDQVACVSGAPVEPGAGLTCGELIACASTALWETAPPTYDGARVYRWPDHPDQVATSGGWIVVFDLSDGSRLATYVGLPSNCPG
jgi:hypothetical protein